MSESFSLREKLAEKNLLVSAETCYNCSTCVNICPVALTTEGLFNPRHIIQLSSGEFESKLYIDHDPNVWLCTMCERCDDACPQGVRLHEIFLEVKNISFELGKAPSQFPNEVKQVFQFGKAIPSSKPIERRRQQLKLPESPQPDPKEIQALLEGTLIAKALESNKAGKKEV